MLREHLDQSHDAASRRTDVIDRQVAWIHETVLGGRPARVLDLGCGPGLYTTRLAALGHECLGVDYGPASIAYARAHAGPRERYDLADVRTAALGSGWDLAMMLFGELNAFRPEDARAIVARAASALAPGGALLIEIGTPEVTRAAGEAPATWRAIERGLFSERPHLRLTDAAWHASQSASAVRHTIVDAELGTVMEFGETLVAYPSDRLAAMLADAGLAVAPPAVAAPSWAQSESFVFVRAVRS